MSFSRRTDRTVGRAWRSALLAGCALSLAMGSALAESRSIVGEWAPLGAGCTPMEGAITIQPLGLVGDDMRCTFRSVARTGDVVTWKGTCGFPENDRPARVVAVAQGPTLTIAINGGRNGPYRRCRG